MARSARQSKILELIAVKEIETQDELVNELRDSSYDVTQATISRDIKELGLIKILSDSKKYKYAFVDSTATQQMSDKFAGIFKESIISIKPAKNIVVVKTLKGMASAISAFIDKMNLEYSLGCVYGEDTVMVICQDDDDALLTYEKLSTMM
ncbi:MAG: arginine repressor [Tenericutes bacterium HGW-Tenericutes-4]|jgi:transcriptional regulator of arginine metabolism|nr:MAG: arginine repressor [Tenericutes bacterium HGW-Tenericutes-4]